MTRRAEAPVASAALGGHLPQEHQQTRREPPRPIIAVADSADAAERADPAEALAERVRAGIDQTPTSDELWIPAWARVAYAARARKGWFLPAPRALAGMADEDPGKP